MFGQIKLIAAIILLAGLAFFVFDYGRLRNENKRLSGEISAANETIKKLDEKARAEAEITKTKDNRLRRLKNVQKSDDAPLAPVLRDVIIELQRDNSK